MEFLDMTSFETIYSEPNKPEDSENNKSAEVVSIIERALSTTDNITLKQFAEGLDNKAKEIFETSLKSKIEDVDKGLITALLKKYPKLKIKEIQQLDFKNHVSNLVDSGKLSNGSLKYLVERLLEIDRVKKLEEQQEEEPQNPQDQPQNEQGAEDVPSQEQQAQQVSQDTENSEFYSEWDRNFNDTETPLTEEDFNDMIDYQEVDGYLRYPSNHRTSSEYKKKNPITLADKFLCDKLKPSSKESTYTSLMVAEDFILGKVLETKYSYGKNALIGTGVGALIGTGVGYLAGSKNRSDSEELKEEYLKSEHKLDTLKAKVVKLKAKGGLSIEDQKQISRLRSEVASLNRSTLLSDVDRGELQGLKSQLATLTTSGVVTRGFTKNEFLKGASFIGESYGRQGLDKKIARLEAKGQAQAQAKAKLLEQEANTRSSKLKLSPIDQEKLQEAISKRKKIKELKEKSESLKSASTKKMVGFGVLGAGTGAIAGYNY